MIEDRLDIAKNRATRKYSLGVQCVRVVWGASRFLFRLIPRPFYMPRRILLRMFGAKIGRNVNISNTALIYFPWNLEVGDWSAIGDRVVIYNLGKITIGAQVAISQHAHLCAGSHDFRDPSMPLLRPPITIRTQAWICADAFIGPNVTVGDGAVVGARAVVFKDVESWSIVAGNPARVIKTRIMEDQESS